MKLNLIFLIVLLTFTFFSVGQEICDNAIDDDGDGWIDLNDDECDCIEVTELESLIPNYSFEEKSCCPWEYGGLSCVNDWIEASGGSPDYYNVCSDFDGVPFSAVSVLPLPGDPGGEGYVGFYYQENLDLDLEEIPYVEYVGACLIAPMIAGNEYELEFYTAWAYGDPDFPISLYGASDCDFLPWTGWGCPIGIDDWMLLADQDITYTTDGEWQLVTFTFTPPMDIASIAIGGDCFPDGGVDINYYYLDELILKSSDGVVVEGSGLNGYKCHDSYFLSIDDIGGSYQWYKDGIALLGETEPILEVLDDDYAAYTLISTTDDGCYSYKRILPLDDLTPNALFVTEDICLGEFLPLENLSSSPSDDLVWNWEFGDGNFAVNELPIHEPSNTGAYEIQLIVTNESCSDALIQTIFVHDTPYVDFTISTELGTFCNDDLLKFQGEVSITVPEMLDNMSWYFGDGTSSDDLNPEHLYAGTGSYDVRLTAISEFGCANEHFEIIQIQDCEGAQLFAPNVFTPGSGDLNDQWYVHIDGIDIYNFHLRIFNRWGEVVWESYDPSKAWDGAYGDQGIVESGVYVWVIETKDDSLDKRYRFEGTVLVLH